LICRIGIAWEETAVTRQIFVGLSAALLFASATAVIGGPVDEELFIDGEKMITRTAAPEGHPFDEVLSGWFYRTGETRVLETDTFQNPGMLRVEEGEAIWNTVEGTEGKSCATCHGDASESMKGISAAYPKWDAKENRPINIELQINRCREANMGAEPYPFDKGGQKPLTAYIKHQSLGVPVELDLREGDMQSWWDRGKDLYYTRTGQLDLVLAQWSCPS
jgi:sulfur-oxidizing protein SoxA